MKWVIINLVVLLAIASFVLAVYYAPESRNQSILHLRNNPGLPHHPETCPPGYRVVKDVFTEKDESKQDACISSKARPGEASLDYLMPGETVHMQIPYSEELLPPKKPDGKL